MYRITAVCALAVAALQGRTVNPIDLLHAATAEVAKQSAGLRNFACEETVSREFHRPGRKSLVWTDRLRLDVGVFGGREFFSWPGAPNPRYTDAAALAGGPATSGEFGPFAIGLFLSWSEPVPLCFTGMQTLSGAPAAVYRYTVNVDSSNFLVRTGPESEAPAPYAGMIFLDPSTARVMRLTADANDLPNGSDLAKVGVDIEYGWQDSGGTRAWLPRRSMTRIAYAAGAYAVNRTEFINCRQFRSDARMSFDEDEQPRVAAPAESTAAPVPARLIVHTAFVSGIDTRNSCTGDPIELEVVKPVESGGRTVIPRGARMFGRIVLLQRHYRNNRIVDLAIRFDHFQVGGVSRRLALG